MLLHYTAGQKPKECNVSQHQVQLFVNGDRVSNMLFQAVI